PENGYYEYSYADCLDLLYIRKLRGAHLSLDAIEATFSSGDAETILDGYRATIESLEEQIRQLKRREMMLRVSYRHYERDADMAGEIRLIEAFDVKVDTYFDLESPDPVRRHWIHNIDLFTMVVCIGQQYFEAETLPEHVPVRLGLGTYEKVLKEEKCPIPGKISVFPRGRYASFFLEIEDLTFIRREKLELIRTFLRKKGLHAQSDSTAYLYRVDHSRGRPVFVFCVRVKVEDGE
ncbi:MAG: MerR family transcriptional regulator, partial [Oscillospiraceae bacterium]|nr:MerR family transcriptional regulator [Oscillospiraceae bacterium]